MAKTKLEKINSLSEEEKEEIKNNFLRKITEMEIDFKINEKPIPYARARAGRYGFYNPKDKDEKRYRKLFKEQLTEEQYNTLKPLLADEESEYYVEFTGDFYIPIQQADSYEKTLYKELGLLPAITRNGDVDNYTKFVLDALHEVIYTDDKRVVKISSSKHYSLNPRSEIKVIIKIINK